MLLYSTPSGCQRRSPTQRFKLDALFQPSIGGLMRMRRFRASSVMPPSRCSTDFGTGVVSPGLARSPTTMTRAKFVSPGGLSPTCASARACAGRLWRDYSVDPDQKQKARFVVLDFPHSDGCYARAYGSVAETCVNGSMRSCSSRVCPRLSR